VWQQAWRRSWQREMHGIMVASSTSRQVASPRRGQAQDHDSKVCYGTCTNHGHLARKPSELLLGAIFCEEFFSVTLVCQVWYFS
jgi:hypothetical protein